jgi:hypothetical protein
LGALAGLESGGVALLVGGGLGGGGLPTVALEGLALSLLSVDLYLQHAGRSKVECAGATRPIGGYVDER